MRMRLRPLSQSRSRVRVARRSDRVVPFPRRRRPQYRRYRRYRRGRRIRRAISRSRRDGTIPLDTICSWIDATAVPCRSTAPPPRPFLLLHSHCCFFWKVALTAKAPPPLGLLTHRMTTAKVPSSFHLNPVTLSSTSHPLSPPPSPPTTFSSPPAPVVSIHTVILLRPESEIPVSQPVRFKKKH